MELLNEFYHSDGGIFSIASKVTTKSFHSHQLAQLSVPKNGIMYLMVDDRVYIVPPNIAILIPGNVQHCVYKINSNTIIENTYFKEEFYSSLPAKVETFNLSVLAQSLITRLCGISKEQFLDEKTKNIITVLLDELSSNHQPFKYEIAMPHDDNLLKIFDYIMNVTDYLPSLDDCAQLIHSSTRSLQRKLKNELNIQFILWRQQIIFAKSLALLAVYKKTSVAAYKLGYNSESAFISMFKKISGQRLPSEFY